MLSLEGCRDLHGSFQTCESLLIIDDIKHINKHIGKKLLLASDRIFIAQKVLQRSVDQFVSWQVIRNRYDSGSCLVRASAKNWDQLAP